MCHQGVILFYTHGIDVMDQKLCGRVIRNQGGSYTKGLITCRDSGPSPKGSVMCGSGLWLFTRVWSLGINSCFWG